MSDWCFFCGELTIVGSLVGMAGPWSGWLLGPALCEGCWLLRQGSVMSLLAAVPEICVPGMCVPGLVLAHWWAELGFGVGGLIYFIYF